MKKILRTIGRPKLRARENGLKSRFASLSIGFREPSLEEGRRRMNALPDFFSTLSPEAIEAIKNFDGPEVMGPPDSKFKLQAIPERGLRANLGDTNPHLPEAPMTRQNGRGRSKVHALSFEELREEARRRIRAKRGIFASLSPEEREGILNYDGPEFLGNPDDKFKL
jgi:hypothetical protein